MEFLIVKQAANKAGTVYACVTIASGGYLVMVKRENYRQGKTVATWRVCNDYRQSHADYQRMVSVGMSQEDATTLYAKKLAGKAK
jgi:hypothetical protein